MAVSGVENSVILNNYIEKQKAEAAAAKAAEESDSASSLYGSYDTFLKILTAQLQNQDPTAPMDASEFTQQLVQYSQVEQQISTNDKLDNMLAALNSNGITPLMGYVGAFVEAPSDGKLIVQNGQAILSYLLPEEAISTKIFVKDSEGEPIATLTGATASGLNRLVWDGTLDDGTMAANGAYSFSITSKNKSGDTITIDDIRIIGQITGIETDGNGKVVLKAGDLSIKDTEVDAVFAGVGAA